MDVELNQLYNKIDVRNVDLVIDSNIHEICKVTNASSSISRSVLYLVIIVSIYSIVIVLDTIPLSWNDYRISKCKNNSINIDQKIDSIKKTINLLKCKNQSDSLFLANLNLNRNKKFDNDQQLLFKTKDILVNDIENRKLEINNLSNIITNSNNKLEFNNKVNDRLIYKKVDDFYYPKLPIIGVSFDINDFALVIGMCMTILLLIRYYTSKRENNNTKIAFKAITERYKNEFTNRKFDWIEKVTNLKEQIGLIRELNIEEVRLTKKVLLSNENLLEFTWKKKEDIINSIISKSRAFNSEDKKLTDVQLADRKSQLEKNKKDIEEKTILELKEKVANNLIDATVFRKINYTRRKYHYNYLSSNEIFNIPKNANNKNTSLIGTRLMVYFLFLVPSFVYLVIVFNDICTLWKAYTTGSMNLITKLLVMEGFFIGILLTLTWLVCAVQYDTQKMWDEFYLNEFALSD